MFLRLFFIFVSVYGQLSVDELFAFNSKYTLAGNCTNYQYSFSNLRINSYIFNQLRFNCQSASLVLENQEHTSTLICPNDEDYSQSFGIHFQHLSQTVIQVNQLRFHGIELCSLDDLVRTVYQEYSYYRSQWALLINLGIDYSKDNIAQEQHHLAIATNGEMTFMLFLLSPEYNRTSIEHDIEIIFPNENIFQFNQLAINVWRIDQGYVQNPKSLENSSRYQLSKSKFTLFQNETFLLYGTQISYPRRFLVTIDGTSASCKYDYILQCTFPILPANVQDTHEPVLQVLYNMRNIFNTTLKLTPRTRLHLVPRNHSLSDIETFEVKIADNVCVNQSSRSLFSFIIHLWVEDSNGTAQYEQFDMDDIGPIDCNVTAKIGQEIKRKMNLVSIDDIISMNVDLIHKWSDHRNCRAEHTRISFI